MNRVYLEYINDIHESGNQLLSLINDILDVSKMEVGRLEISQEWFDLHQLIKYSVRMLQERATLSSHVISMNLANKPTVLLWADQRGVGQCLLNLLSNSIKYTKSGGRIVVETHITADDGIEVVISDNGIGIPASHLDRVTRPFERIDNAYKGSVNGTGLGLPIVKGLMELHGGSLDISSKEGEGTTVKLRFPPHKSP